MGNELKNEKNLGYLCMKTMIDVGEFTVKKSTTGIKMVPDRGRIFDNSTTTCMQF